MWTATSATLRSPRKYLLQEHTCECARKSAHTAPVECGGVRAWGECGRTDQRVASTTCVSRGAGMARWYGTNQWSTKGPNKSERGRHVLRERPGQLPDRSQYLSKHTRTRGLFSVALDNDRARLQKRPKQVDKCCSNQNTPSSTHGMRKLFVTPLVVGRSLRVRRL